MTMKKSVKLIALALCMCLLVSGIPISVNVWAADVKPVNGTFEDGAQGQLPANWTVISTNSGGVPSTDNWGGNYTVSVVVDGSRKALKLTPKTATRGYVSVISDAFSVDAQTSYTVFYDQKIENPDDVSGTSSKNYGAKVLTYYYDADMNYLGADWKDGIKAQQDWTEKSFEIKSLANTSYMRVGFYIGGTWNGASNFAYLYDNVTVKKTDEIGNEPEPTPPETTTGEVIEPQPTEPEVEIPPIVDFNGDAEQTNDGTLPNWTVTQMNSNCTIATNSNWPFTATAGIGQGVDGSNSLRFRKNKGYGYAAMTSIAVDVAPDTYYRLDYMLKFSDVSGAGRFLGLRAIVEELDASGSQVNWYKVDDTGSGIGADNDLSNGYSSDFTQWTPVATGFKTGENTKKIRLYFWMGGISGSNQGTADLDNIVLAALSEKELINGGLEMVNLGHVKDGRKGEVAGQVFWTPETTYPWGYTSRTDSSFTSNYAMILANDGENHKTAAKIYVSRSGGGLGAATYYSEPVVVKPGEDYTTTYDLKITGVDNTAVTGGAVFLVRFLDADENVILLGTDAKGNEIQAKDLNGHPKANQEWKAYSHTFTVPENARYIQLGMTIGVSTKDTNPNMAYWYDNITLKSVRDAEDLWSDLSGKTILWAGDELAQSFAAQSESVSAMKPTVAAVAGAGFADSFTNRVLKQLSGSQNEAYLVIAGYPADAKQNISAGNVKPEGELNGFDTATYAGALEELFLAVASGFDGKKVALVFPAAGEADLSAYHAVAKAACEKWRIPFIDLYGENLSTNEEMYQAIKDDLEKLTAYNALSVPGYSVENVLSARLDNLIGDGVTPATNVDALVNLAAEMKQNGLTELLEKAEGYLAQYEAFRPQMWGATIGAVEPNGLRFMGCNPQVENVQISRCGILMSAKANLKGELTLYTEGAIAYETENPKAGSGITGTAVGEAIDPAVEYVVVAYTVYLVDGDEYAFYSVNDYTNANGKETAIDGKSVCSVYGIAKDMAKAILNSKDNHIDYAAIGGQENAPLIEAAQEEGTEVTCLDVFKFVCDNRDILSESN